MHTRGMSACFPSFPQAQEKKHKIRTPLSFSSTIPKTTILQVSVNSSSYKIHSQRQHMMYIASSYGVTLHIFLITTLTSMRRQISSHHPHVYGSPGCRCNKSMVTCEHETQSRCTKCYEYCQQNVELKTASLFSYIYIGHPPTFPFSSPSVAVCCILF